MPSLSPGTLVRARQRDWVVLPQTTEEVVRLRPVDGTEADAIGLFSPLDGGEITEATYPLPDPSTAGDFAGARLVYDAVRLNLRSGAGPFRSLGRLSVWPRPYQYVPLLMALKLDPVRLLIADDVGVGKTIEAGMIVRELLDRGAVRRVGVLCAPHLCDQWAEELETKFHIETAVVQPSKMARLERGLPPNVGVFKHYQHLVASIDFVKSDRWRRAFIANAPDLIIVDEAHTSARPRGDRGGPQHRRYALLRELAQADPSRHIILTTATPHSGIEESFRSLLGLLDPDLDTDDSTDIPRAKLKPHLIQRRRADLEHWLGEDTPFPDRESAEHEYQLTGEYLSLFDDVLAYCRESVVVDGAKAAQQRVRYWAAIAILRCLLSSPAAATAMLTKRRERTATDADDAVENPEEADARHASQILDSSDDDQAPDFVPTAALDDPAAELTDAEIQRLTRFLKRAEDLKGPKPDAKLKRAAAIVDQMLRDGQRPIVFCRFIDTATYVAENLQKMLAKKHKGLQVRSVTGSDGDSDQRKEIVRQLAEEPVRVLVATDCLSEGINLQEWFDAVLHYDLPWNPNRLEQREGRVDRYGQEKDTVQMALLYGANNQIDLVVLRVLIQKARRIRQQLGISVPVPVESEQVVQAVVESVLLHDSSQSEQLQLALDDPRVSAVHAEWDRAADRELKRRGIYAQDQFDPEAVRRELDAIRPIIGEAGDVRRFVGDAIQRFNGQLETTKKEDVFRLNLGSLAPNLEPLLPTKGKGPPRVAFDGVPGDDIPVLGRNHQVVEFIANEVFGRALSGDDSSFARCGAIYTDAVTVRTAVLLLRLRYQLTEKGRSAGSDLFAEEVLPVAFQRESGAIQWLESVDAARELMESAQATANMPGDERQRQVEWALGMLEADDAWCAPIVEARRDALRDAHERLRKELKSPPKTDVMPHAPPDVLGCYVLVPAGGS